LLGRNVKKSSIFETVFNKLCTCVVLFLTVQWSFSSRIQIANIYLYPLSYASSFYFANTIGNIFHLLESDLSPKAAPDIDEQLLLAKLSKLSLPSSEAVHNITLLSRIDHRLSHFLTRCVTNCLPFFSQIHHFASDAVSDCALCGTDLGDNPIHLLVQCKHKRDSTLLLLQEYPQLTSDFSSQPGAFLGVSQQQTW